MTVAGGDEEEWDAEKTRMGGREAAKEGRMERSGGERWKEMKGDGKEVKGKNSGREMEIQKVPEMEAEGGLRGNEEVWEDRGIREKVVKN